jgi:hypothetical protein
VSIQLGPYVRGEIQAPLRYTFQDANGNVIDLSGYTAKFSCREQDGAPSLYSAVLVGDPTTGQVGYTWTGVEWATAGHYMAEFWVGNGINRLCSLLLEFDVRTPVGSIPAI